MADLDNLQINIEAGAEDASKKLDKLAKSMLRLASSMSINVGKMNGIAVGIKSISASAANLNSRNISTLATSLNKLSRVDTNGIYNTSAALRTFSSSFGGISTTSIAGVGDAASALSRLGRANVTQGTTNLLAMKDQLVQFVQGMNSVGPLTFDATNLSNVITAISKLGGKFGTQATANLPSISAQLQNFVRQMNQIGSLTFDTSNLTSLVTAISKLGSVASGRAVTNIPLLADNLKYLFETLSKAPNVSQNIIDMTNALAKLAKTGASSGRAANSLTSSLNSFGSSANRSRRSAFSLAAAFGKFYATYWLVIRAFKQFGKAIDISSSLTEVENVVRTTFGNMEYKVNDFAQNSIRQFGMSELSVKQYASTFQAMGSAMGISSSQVGSANKFLNGMTEGYVGLSNSMADVSLNLTKLTADMASFYNMDQADVAKDLQSVYTGMVVPLRKYGLDLTQATLKEWAMKNGLDANIDSMTQAEKTMLRYQYVMANTRAAQGDFARTADTWHNQITILKQSFQQLAAIIGGSLINALKPFVKALNHTLEYVISFAKTVSESLGQIFGWKYEVTGGGIASDFEDAADATGNIASGLEDAEKASKKLKNNIYAFDEINKGSSSSSASGIGSGAGAGTGVGSNLGGQWSKTDSLMENYKSELDNLFKLGRHISDTLSKAMESIDWNAVYEKARSFGTGLADFLNGLITPRLFGNVGKTIAGSLNTAVQAALSFGITLDWKQIGLSIAEGVNQFFATFNFEDFAKTVNVWVQGLWTTITTAITHINWMQAYDKIIEFFENLDIGTVAIIIGALTIKKIMGLHLASTIVDFIGKSISKKIGASIASNLGIEMAAGGGIGKALAGAGKTMGSTLLMGAKATLGNKEAQLVFTNPVTAAAAGIETAASPIMTTLTGIAGLVGGAGIAVVNFVSMWQNGFSVIKEILMGVGLAVGAVAAVILGVPATIAVPIAAIVGAVGTAAVLIHEHWDTIKETFIKFSEWLDGVFTIDWTTKFGVFGEIMNGFSKNVSNIWESVKRIFNGVISFFSGVFTGNWSKAWNGIKNVFKGTWDLMVSIVKAPINGIISGINALISGAENGINAVIKVLNRLHFDIPRWVPRYGGRTFGFNISQVSVPRIPMFEAGGFPEDGLFFANHNEMVGQFANGKNAVANNEQIIEGIKQGVIEAMMEVMMATSGNGQNDTSIEIPLYIGNEEIARATSKGINSLKRRGVILPEFA